jgi:hypothetical protein
LVTKNNNQWDQILPLAKFSYNDSPNKRTRKTPFKIVYGMHPRGILEFLDLKHDDFISVGVGYFST